MKLSQAFRVVLASSHYVAGVDEKPCTDPRSGQSQFFCCASTRAAVVGLISHSDEMAIRAEIEEAIGLFDTLGTYLARNVPAYNWRMERWGHNSRACFNIRKAWLVNLANELEEKGK